MMNSAIASNRTSPSPHVQGFRPQFPYHMVWISTNACNARCSHCSSASAKRLPNELTTEEAKSMFDQLAAAGVFNVAISGGEPLTRKDIFEVIAHATSLGIRVGLGSNGTTINPKVVRKLYALGIDRLQISMDGMETSHDELRKWPGLYQKVLKAIAMAIDGGLRVNVCFTLNRHNKTEVEACVAKAVELGVSRFNLSRFIPTGRGQHDLDMPHHEWRAVLTKFEHTMKKYAGQIQFSTHLAQQILLEPKLSCHTGYIGCQAGIGQGCIGPCGEVSPCVMLPAIVGNIRSQSFADIWTGSAELHKLRDRSNLKGHCGTCSFRENCGGCRAVALAYHNDMYAQDPRCWIPTNQFES